MKVTFYSSLIFVVGLFACSGDSDNSDEPQSPVVLSETIFKYRDADAKKPFGFRLGFYYDNGKEYRWMDLDSLQNLETDYIAQYDSNWIQTGALYTEPGDDQYYKELVAWPNDSTKVTEWVDSAGTVYYTMTDYLNNDGKTKAAQFKGDRVHGYDTTEYDAQGFVSRIYFTNSKGQVRNDRSFVYDSIDPYGNWVERRMMRDDTTSEVQRRSITFQDSIYFFKSRFQLGIISLPWEEENCVSMTMDGQQVFLTKAVNWDQQQPILFTRHHGQYSMTDSLLHLGTIYNGAISLDGTRIIYVKKVNDTLSTYITSHDGTQWSSPEKINSSQDVSGYFSWIDNELLAFHHSGNRGDIAIGRLTGTELSLVDPMESFNTPDATEFSLCFSPEMKYAVFTRYSETDRHLRGLYLSTNTGSSTNPEWSEPQKVLTHMYGWGGQFSSDGELFYFTFGEDIWQVPVEELRADN